MIRQENSSGFILRSFSNWASLFFLSFLTTFNNSFDGLLMTNGSFVYSIICILFGGKDTKYFRNFQILEVFFNHAPFTMRSALPLAYPRIMNHHPSLIG